MTTLRRVAASHVLVAVAVLVLGAGIAGGALVGFSAEDQHASSTFAGGWLGAPTGLGTPAPTGYGASLSWTAATHGLTDQALYGTDQGTTNTCAGATYATQLNASLGVATTSTTDNQGAGANGHWLCYQIRSIRTGTSWTATANFAVVQVGLVGSTLTAAEGGGNSGQIQNGDTIAVAFNQAITYGGAASISVCAFTSGTILIGDTGCGAATDTPTIAKITGLTIANNRTYTSSTVSASGSTLTISLAGGGNGANGRANVSGTGTVTWTSSNATLHSTSGSASVCTAANCAIAYAGGF